MTQTERPRQQAMLAKTSALAESINRPVAAVAQRCQQVWPDADQLDTLADALPEIPGCCLLHASGIDYIAVSPVVQAELIDRAWRE